MKENVKFAFKLRPDGIQFICTGMIMTLDYTVNVLCAYENKLACSTVIVIIFLSSESRNGLRMDSTTSKLCTTSLIARKTWCSDFSDI